MIRADARDAAADGGLRRFSGSRLDVGLLVGAIVGGAALLAPHLAHPFWQDEVKTLELFARDGFLHPFRVYPFPNNHVLSSALLAVWGDIGGSDAATEPMWMRSLPGVTFLLAATLLAVSTARLGRARAGVLAAALFATSHVSLSFASELRGYGLSWLPMVVAFAVMPGYLRSGGAGRAALYALATGACVAILPTNLLLAVVYGVWGLVMLLAEGRPGESRFPGRVVFLFVAPACGLIAYTAVWSDLMSQAGRGLGSWTLLSIAGHWLWATLRDFVWLVPVAAWGGVILWRTRDAGAGDSSPRIVLAFSACIAAVPLLALSLLPNTPYARNLVPVLPLWYAAVALLFDAGWARLWRRAPRFESLAFVGLMIGLFGVATGRESVGAGYSERHPGRPHELVQNLYDQYYHHEFRPGAMADAVLRRMREQPDTVFFTDHNGLWVVGAEVERRAGRQARSRLVHFRERDAAAARHSSEASIFLLGHSVERAREMTRLHGLPEAREADLVEASGFFAIFEVDAASPVGAAKR